MRPTCPPRDAARDRPPGCRHRSPGNRRTRRCRPGRRPARPARTTRPRRRRGSGQAARRRSLPCSRTPWWRPRRSWPGSSSLSFACSQMIAKGRTGRSRPSPSVTVIEAKSASMLTSFGARSDTPLVLVIVHDRSSGWPSATRSAAGRDRQRQLRGCEVVPIGGLRRAGGEPARERPAARPDDRVRHVVQVMADGGVVGELDLIREHAGLRRWPGRRARPPRSASWS